MSDRHEFVLARNRSAAALARAQMLLASLPIAKAWRIRISVARNERSLPQNAYLWAVPYKLLGEYTGYDAEELHEYFCGEYFGWRETRVPKRPSNPRGTYSLPVRTTTTDEHGKRDVLAWERFSDFVGYIQRFAAEKCQIFIPDPDPNYMLKRERTAA